MQHSLIQISGIAITGWKIIGYFGVFLFASRWFVQIFTSKKAGRPVITRWFWLLSLAGSILLLSYFAFGKNDSIGILSNAFPAFIAVYNLVLDMRYTKKVIANSKLDTVPDHSF